jgi:very-short-patch-repair endonuclease
MEEKNIHIQHAMNGGEYGIPELGYFVDGYDKDNNTVYEFDEKHHYLPNGELRECDKNRQKEIEDFLKCKFIRIKEDEINRN